jgi:hypothetical protein
MFVCIVPNYYFILIVTMFCPEFPPASLSSHMPPSTICGCIHEKNGLQNPSLPGDSKPSFEGREVEEEAQGTCPPNTA